MRILLFWAVTCSDHSVGGAQTDRFWHVVFASVGTCFLRGNVCSNSELKLRTWQRELCAQCLWFFFFFWQKRNFCSFWAGRFWAPAAQVVVPRRSPAESSPCAKIQHCQWPGFPCSVCAPLPGAQPAVPALHLPGLLQVGMLPSHLRFKEGNTVWACGESFPQPWQHMRF